MESTLKVLNDLETQGVLTRYAIGGAMALLFHTEPVATFDLNIFCFIPESGPLITLAPLYDALKAGGHTIDAEHVVIAGVPVQFIPAYNPLVIEALSESQERTFGETPTRVLRLEHLLAIMLQTGRPKDWQRAAMVSASAPFDESRLLDILNRHGLTETWNRIRSPH
ncbi:MAG TPA: hypothetical protein VK137_17810 [Planctomycetaceae bacterium]|nr:hypothetical protein [Planctomycetaceae bacterium]